MQKVIRERSDLSETTGCTSKKQVLVFSEEKKYNGKRLKAERKRRPYHRTGRGTEHMASILIVEDEKNM